MSNSEEENIIAKIDYVKSKLIYIRLNIKNLKRELTKMVDELINFSLQLSKLEEELKVFRDKYPHKTRG